MNSIDTATPRLLPQQITAPLPDGPTPPKANEIEQVRDTPTAVKSDAKRFYEYEEQPWLNTDEEIKFYTKSSWLQTQHIYSMMELNFTSMTYDQIIEKLKETEPLLAATKFGFTMDEHANILIIDYDNRLSEPEKALLSNLLNEQEGIKGCVQRHARIMMTLLDHDMETFGRRYNVTLDNFRHTIDYAKVLQGGIEAMHEEWIRQIHANAEKRDVSDLHIEA